ncbi:hypothetical protein DYY67_1830 [Candidatus Nitrosotalea sp. TS]|uniref:hypothetical protein n=1 Tax=Candidatus Nitrosotalea sp. TS TaxID=2341020 RepID=UPI001EBABD1E|nr:hypothetical protein [Candidatus Nitrosotalea sp. TS]NHI02754.1 hypothetical protein [Candidatus Nitrosotalea sp. TS]
MANEKNTIDEVSLEKSVDKVTINDNIAINVKFSVTGGLREAFNEKNWERAYNKHDNVFKLKYGVKLYSGGLRKRAIGTPLDTYKKALFSGHEIQSLPRWQKRRSGYRYPRTLSRTSQ